jgi:hypothetical protein
MSELIKKKKAELAEAIEGEIKESITKLMNDDFNAFINKIMTSTREDQLDKILGKSLASLIKEYKRQT